MKKIVFLCFFLSGCSSVPFPKSNITTEQAMSVKVGQSAKEIIEAFGNPLQWQNFEDGTYLHIYPNDWQDGAQVFCRNLAIAYGSDDKVAKYWFTKDGSDPQQRCNHYSAYSAQQAAAWNSFASSYSKALEDSNTNNSSSSSSGKFCHYYDSGMKGLCYFSLSSCRSAIYGDRGGFCTFEQD